MNQLEHWTQKQYIKLFCLLSFTEVEHDLATLKVIGFKTKNIRRLFLRQNLIFSIIGFIFCIPWGYYVLRIMMNTTGNTFNYPVVIR